MEKKQYKKVVLAYSGGLDTSIIIAWLKENYGCEVIAYLRILLGLLLHLCTSPLYEMHHDGRKWASIKATIFVSRGDPH